MENAHDPQFQLAERYFLGELTDDEAESFEAHYFECQRCAEYVVEEMAMLESGRHVAAALPAPQRNSAPAANVTPIADKRPRHRSWLPAAAAAILVLAVGAPLLMRNRATPTVEFVEPQLLQFSADRSSDAAPPTFAVGAPIMIDAEIALPPGFSRFELTVRDTATGAIIDRLLTLTPERAEATVPLLLSNLSAGSYEVVIEGVREDGKRSPVGSKPFEVREKERQP